MNKIESIAAVVITYNRLPLLKQCIDALKGQTRKLDAIVVVNNGSSDGTGEWLTQQDGLTVVYQNNSGSSGGFYTGIEAAYAGGYDRLWIMDDDAFPQRDCLECLVKAQGDLGEKNAVLAPVVIEGDAIDESHRGFIDPRHLRQPLQHPLRKADIYSSQQSVIKVTFVSFVGMFISREVVKEIGLPRVEYYMFHDDVEYCIRMQKRGFSFYLVKEAIIYHKLNNSGLAEITDFKDKLTKEQMFVKPRITALWKERYATLEDGEVVKFIAKRNWLRTVITNYGISIQLLYILSKKIVNVLGYALFSKGNNRTVLNLYAMAFRQAISGQFRTERFLAIKEKLRK
jgi:rhamnopyranosyl-N-acetylglucosaminyl-diphospho-decaprenol beta-1,3/1,4-galactofuranosyltransferase